MSFKVSMERQHKPRSGVPLGGIGTGGVELRQDGLFYEWNIFSNQPIGTGPFFDYPNDTMLFFVIRWQEEGQDVAQMKILQIDEGYEVGTIASHYRSFPWLTGVDRIDYEGAFPFVRLKYSDKEMPLEVELEAFSPFIPHDVKNSNLPGAFFNFKVKSKTGKPVDVLLMATMRNAVGYDDPNRFFDSKVHKGGNYRAIEFCCGDMDETRSSWGQQVLASLSADSNHYAGWEHRHPYYEIVLRNKKLPDLDKTPDRNRRNKETGKATAGPRCFGSIGRSVRLKKGEAFDHSFAMSWYFPNLYAGATFRQGGDSAVVGRRLEGHYYSNHFQNAAEVAAHMVKNKKSLEDKTRKFFDAFYDSSAEPWVLDQINSHLSTFVKSAWLTQDMNFGVQEGLTPTRNWGPMATIDVGMYGNIPAAILFPELQKNSMRAHKRLQRPSGEIAHGIARDFTKTDAHAEHVKGRLDLPSQYVCMVLRDYFWTADKEYLVEMWPSVKEALDYVIRERDMNQDALPDMEGSMCSYDNFPMYGAASYVSSAWLAALKSAVVAADALGDIEAKAKYAELLERGDRVFEQKLWNGEYYRLYNDEGGPRGDMDEGCLADQIIGQWQCHQSGLGDLFKPERRKKVLRAIHKMCMRKHGLVNCAWPGDSELKDVPDTCWDDQFNTTWSGTELEFASFLVYEGMWKEARAIIKNVDDRYRKFGMYWDHQEFGGHYFRPMVSWLIINAMLGLTIRDQAYGFAPRIPGDNQRLFFAFSEGYAHYNRKTTKTAETMSVEIDEGVLVASELRFELLRAKPSKARVAVDGKAVGENSVRIAFENSTLILRYPRKLKLKAGQKIEVVAS